MLFAYTYVSHSMEKMQGFIDFIFNEVWCKAPIGLEFSSDLFETVPDLKEIISYFGFTAKAPERGKQFYKDIKSIYEFFASLSPLQIDQLNQWYQANNDIENVCANNPRCFVARYPDIEAIHPELSAQLASFFKGLYSKDLLGLSALSKVIGKIDDHYQEFMKINNTGKCPFCGISDMLSSVYTHKREAYDHYLPKGLYPFNSINFRNLVPACHHCNSTFKSSRDPAFVPKDPAGQYSRRKAFYLYKIGACCVTEIAIDLDTLDIDRADIQISFGPNTIDEEIATWREVYGIDARYREKLLSDGKAWLVEVLDEWRWRDESAGSEGRTPDEYLRDLSRHTKRSPYTNSNFLKNAFLEGCQRAGLLDNVQTNLG